MAQLWRELRTRALELDATHIERNGIQREESGEARVD
jgi:hypothetical protein